MEGNRPLLVVCPAYGCFCLPVQSVVPKITPYPQAEHLLFSPSNPGKPTICLGVWYYNFYCLFWSELILGSQIMRNLPGKQSTEWTISFLFIFLSIYKYFNRSLRKICNSLVLARDIKCAFVSQELGCLYLTWLGETVVLKSCHHGGFYLQWVKTTNHKQHSSLLH